MTKPLGKEQARQRSWLESRLRDENCGQQSTEVSVSVEEWEEGIC